MQGDLGKKVELCGGHGFSGQARALLSPGMLAVLVYRFGAFSQRVQAPLFRLPLKLAYFVLFYLIQAFTGISVQAYTKIGKRFVILNHTCIFVLAEQIGDDFTVCQGVTVGNVRGKRSLPRIGNNVFLEPGCKVLGEVTLGNNVIVRANSLVLNDLPSDSMAMGNPARVVSPKSKTAAVGVVNGATGDVSNAPSP